MHPKWFERITVWVFSTQSQSTRGNISIPSKPQATNNVNSNSMWADFCGLLQTAEFFYFSLIRNCVIEHMTTQITSVGSRIQQEVAGSNRTVKRIVLIANSSSILSKPCSDTLCTRSSQPPWEVGSTDVIIPI